MDLVRHRDLRALVFKNIVCAGVVHLERSLCDPMSQDSLHSCAFLFVLNRSRALRRLNSYFYGAPTTRANWMGPEHGSWPRTTWLGRFTRPFTAAPARLQMYGDWKLELAWMAHKFSFLITENSTWDAVTYRWTLQAFQWMCVCELLSTTRPHLPWKKFNETANAFFGSYSFWNMQGSCDFPPIPVWSAGKAGVFSGQANWELLFFSKIEKSKCWFVFGKNPREKRIVMIQQWCSC